jgi:hypothetical protein
MREKEVKCTQKAGKKGKECGKSRVAEGKPAAPEAAGQYYQSSRS